MAIRLKNWRIYSLDPNKIAPPWCRMVGDVYGHPRFDDGTHVGTSYVVKIENHGDYVEATTLSGSVYHLYKEDEYSEAEEDSIGARWRRNIQWN